MVKPIIKKHIFMDWRVVKFLTSFQYKRADALMSLEQKVKLIESAIQDKQKLEIVYLKANDVKSKRVIKPLNVGEMEYLSKRYLGVEAYCHERNDNRVFRVDRILGIKLVTGG